MRCQRPVFIRIEINLTFIDVKSITGNCVMLDSKHFYGIIKVINNKPYKPNIPRASNQEFCYGNNLGGVITITFSPISSN